MALFSAWGRILTGYTPALSIEITRECPLRCPGCYAYGDDHLGGDITLREVRDFKGQELIDGVSALVDRHRPLHLSIVGGEPLVRYRELNTLLPILVGARHPRAARDQRRARDPGGVARPSAASRSSSRSTACSRSTTSRRTPATYDRILKHIDGHQITVHCTVTRQQVNRPGYLEEFLAVLVGASRRSRRSGCSLYTPQIGEVSDERLGRPIASGSSPICWRCACDIRSSTLPQGLIDVYANPPDVARRVRLRADDDDDLRRSDDADHAVPVRRRRPIAATAAASRRPVWPRSRATSCSASSRSASIFTGSLKVGEQRRRLRPAEPSAA